MGRKSFKGGALLAPVPPAMITVGVGDEANVLTVGWCGILATVPPRTYISVRPERHSYKLLKEHGEFVINLAPTSMARTVDFVGTYTGAKVDKFERCSLTKAPCEHVLVPLIKECPIAIECRVCEVIPMGSHDVFIADIVGFSADEDIIDESGRICFEKADLLAYMHGEYYALGERLGKFGFSATREKKASKPKAPRENEQINQGAKGNTQDSRTNSIKRSANGELGAIKSERARNRDKESNNKSDKQPFYKSLPPHVLRKSGKRPSKKRR